MASQLITAIKSIGLRTKFVLLVSLVLVGIFGFFAAYLIRGNTQTLRANLYNEAKAFATLSTTPIGNTFAIYKDSGQSKIDQAVRNATELNQSITNVAIVNVESTVEYNQHQDIAVEITPDEAASFKPIYKYASDGTLNTVIFPYFEASGAHRYSMVYAISDAQIETAIQKDTMSSLAFVIFALLITGGAIYLLINLLIIRPVESVSEQAEIISGGNLDQQIEIHARDEIGRLSQSVNSMAESLKKSIAELKEVDKVKSEFMMITSHNLRTPLTIISGYMENADRYSKDPEMMSQIIEKISASVQRLEMFAEDVLTISRFELGEQDKTSESVALLELVQHIADDFNTNAQAKQIEFVADLQLQGVSVQASAPHLRSALWNLLDNALKFTKEGGKIILTGRHDNGRAYLAVNDTGVGISPEELPKLFTKFHRGTSTLTYDFGGTGIGLYASKVMIENYGGTITVSSEPGKGSTFTISLPCQIKLS